MILKKQGMWLSFWCLLCFAAITLFTASLQADVDGTDDYGFPWRFSRTGGLSLNVLTGEKQGTNDFDPGLLGLDLLFAVFLTIIINLLWSKYKRSRKVVS